MLSLRNERTPRLSPSELTTEKAQKTKTGPALGEVMVSPRQETGHVGEQLYKYMRRVILSLIRVSATPE